MAKANKRFKRLKSFRVKDDKKKIRAFSASVVAARIWGHQAQGISPKVLKTLRKQAASLAHLQTLGCVDIVLSLGEHGVKDPGVEIVAHHWRALSKVFRANGHVGWLTRTWEVWWSRLNDKHRRKRVVGPLGALIAYLKDMGVNATTMPVDGDLPPSRLPSNTSGTFWRTCVTSGFHPRKMVEGVDWSVPNKILDTTGLVFGTDVSGGTGSSHPRTRVVSWAVIAGMRTEEGFRLVGR